MSDHRQLDPPISLDYFFPASSSSSEEDELVNNNRSGTDDNIDAEHAHGYNHHRVRRSKRATNGEFDPYREIQTITLCGMSLQVRQSSYHSHNANCVWPGTFNLCEYLLRWEEEEEEKQPGRENGLEGTGHARMKKKEPPMFLGDVLELGAATGLLSIRLALAGPSVCSSIVTSDLEEENGEVEENICHNLCLNGIVNNIGNGHVWKDDDNVCLKSGHGGYGRSVVPLLHVPHTWGTGWDLSAQRRGLPFGKRFDTILASDILLYVSSYPALVRTLCELFDSREGSREGERVEEQETCRTKLHSRTPKTTLILSWKRRMKESREFFERMESAGFLWHHEGKCIYIFTKKSSNALVSHR